MNQLSSIAVGYKNVDGWHVFTCEDVPGFYVASKDGAAAYEDVGYVLEQMLQFNEGVDCGLKPETPVNEFLSSLRAKKQASRTLEVSRGATEERHTPIVMSDRRFALLECSA